MVVRVRRAGESGTGQCEGKGSSVTATGDDEGFSAEERAAMRARATESRRGKGLGKVAKAAADAEAVLEAIAAMPEDDRLLAERVHRIITETAPRLAPKTWYGFPAYAEAAGKVVCFVQPASRFGARYATLGFNDAARLDSGTMWPVAYALTALGASEDEQIRELVRRAVG